MAWDVEFTDEFEAWWLTLDEVEQDAISAVVRHLQEVGPGMRRPAIGHIKGSTFGHMRELRIPGNLRVLFAFDPRRVAILLIGGNKTNDWAGWYQRMIPLADQLYRDHLQALREEGLLE